MLQRELLCLTHLFAFFILQNNKESSVYLFRVELSNASPVNDLRTPNYFLPAQRGNPI